MLVALRVCAESGVLLAQMRVACIVEGVSVSDTKTLQVRIHEVLWRSVALITSLIITYCTHMLYDVLWHDSLGTPCPHVMVCVSYRLTHA